MNDEVLSNTLLALELQLLSPKVRSSAVRLGELLGDEFVEFGASGRVYDKQGIIPLLSGSKSSETFHIDSFRLVTSGEREALATYTCEARSDTGDMLRKSNRSSLWILRQGRWQLIFHQGTGTE